MSDINHNRMIPLHIADQAVAACEKEIAGLKAEIARLKAEVERLRKAGDAMKDAVETYFELMPMLVNEVRAKAMLKGRKAIKDWLAAKEGKPSV